MKVIYRRLKFFICNFNDLVTKPVSLLKKRVIVWPHSFFYKTRNQINFFKSKKNKLYYVVDNTITLDKTVAKLLFQDIYLL